TNKADWLYFLDTIWEPGLELHALDDCIDQVGNELGAPKTTQPVILMIPYPSSKQKDFGDVDGDGRSEDLSTPQDRDKVVAWFVDEALRRWESSKFSHLKLWGFYWMNEGISPADEPVVRRTSDYVHRRGYKMHWIPWFVAPGHTKWRELGFDFVIMQPNFAFIEPTGGRRLPNEDRLTDNANRARSLALGVEMELNGRETTQPESRWNLRQYLNHGVDELDGTMRGAARAWYQGYDFVRRLYESDNPECNQLYKDLYRFHKGTYRQRVSSQAEGCRCKVSVGSDPAGEDSRTEKRLTDGLWVTEGSRLGRALRLKTDKATVLVDLRAATLVEDVRVHLIGSSFPNEVRVRTGLTPESLAPAGQSSETPDTPAGETTAGFVIVTFAARAARYVEVQLLAPNPIEMRLDEIVIPPASHLLWGAPYTIEGGKGASPGLPLTDGLHSSGKVRWSRKGKASFRIEPGRFSNAIRARVVSSRKPPTVTAMLNGNPIELKGLRPGDSWAEGTFRPTPVSELQLVFNGKAPFSCDEVQLLPAPNLALSKPYALDPPFPSAYPDGGGELTDGDLTAEGFGDGKTVGWVQTIPEVTVDLGGVRSIEAARVHVEGGGHGWVNFPERITVSTSVDGDSWTRVAEGRPEPELTADRAVEGGRMSLGWMKLQITPTETRFVRLRFVTTGWTMLSEIAVLASGENVARGARYLLHPQPTSQEKYADNAGYLTDGRYGSGFGWAGCAGWDKADPAISVDLQAERTVGAVSAHVIGGGAGAVYFPSKVSFSVSSDGVSWREIGAVTDAPGKEERNGVLPGAMSVALPQPVEARFVRVHIQRHGWVMVDEIEVFGP
ncbi:MAG: DUF4855 domain-containing protein, partial [Armatimonadetes bacterium]|nr:DUF4855 domain-containing protein [Armatimonadota bacterium]